MAADVLETLLVILKGDDAQLKRTLKGIERETADTKKKVGKNLDFGSIGANLGGLVGGGGVLFALRSFAGESAKAKGEAQSFFNTLERAGISQSGITADLQTTADSVGLLTTQLQGAATPLLKLGVDAETTNAVLLGLASSAGIAGKSGAELANAVAQSAVGIAQGRSELLETSSVLVNASQAQKTFADSIGVSVSALSDEQKALAYARAVIAETKPDVEDFADTYGEYAKSQSAAAKASDEFRKSVGAIAQEGLVPLNNALAIGLGFVNDLPDPVQRSGVAFVAAGAGALTLAGGIGTLALVLGPLTGPAGLLVLVAAGVAALVTAAGTAPGPVRELGDALDGLKTANEEYQTALQNASEAETTAAGQRLENAKTTAQAALEETRARLSQAEAQLEAAQQAATYNPEGYSFVAPELATNVETYRAAVAKLEEQVKSAQTTLSGGGFTPLPLLNPPGSTPTNTPTGSGKADRTVSDVFGDLAKEGTVAEQRAAALGTLEAQVESLETRANAASGALDDVLELGGTPEQVDYLVGLFNSLNDELVALGEKPIDITVGVQVARNIVPDVEAQVAALQDIPTPELKVEITGDPVDIFGVVFDPLTGTTSVGAVPTIKIRAEVDIVTPDARAILNTDPRQILGTGYEPGSSRQVDYGPNPYTKTGGSVPLLTSPDYRGDMPTVDVDEAGKRITEAGDIFKSGVLEAGQGFANALADGKISGEEGGGILGGLLGAGLGAGGIALGIPPQLSLALGGIIGDLTGGLLGGLFGGDDESDSRSRAAKDMERRGGASAITFNLFASQTNSFSGNIVEPQVQSALDRQVDQLVKSALERVNFDRVAKKATA